jgi:subtilisin family serine protease
LDRIDQHDLPLNDTYTYAGNGAGVNVYLIDTGINSSHVEVAGRIGNGHTEINDGFGTEDCNGHGTHVAGIAGGTTFGVAKAATLHPVRVLNCDGEGSYSAVIAGIDWVTRHHVAPSVANMSLGGAASAAMDSAIRNSIAAGVTYVVAAGNFATDACTESPARLAQALVVGASTQRDTRASFSNYGACVDLFAPGQGILSAFTGSNTATATASGTSMAAPFVTGAVALYLQAQPAATPAQVASVLLANATADHLTNAGSGSPNLLLYSNFDTQTVAPLQLSPSLFLPLVTKPR